LARILIFNLLFVEGPKPSPIIRLLHQRRRHHGIDLRRGQPLVPHLLLDHGNRHATHESIHHVAVPEDMRRDLPAGELLPLGNLLQSSLLPKSPYGPKNRLGAQVATAPAWEEPLLDGLNALPDGLQGGLVHSGGPETAGLGPAALDADKTILKIDVINTSNDQFTHTAAKVVEAKEDETVSSPRPQKRGILFL
jgi:hypothetical protein